MRCINFIFYCLLDLLNTFFESLAYFISLFDLSETLNEERSFGSKQAYLTIILPESFRLREGNAGTWSIEDEGNIFLSFFFGLSNRIVGFFDRWF